MRWNLPGPLGVNPFPKAPHVGGRTMPLFIAQGSADDVIQCIAPAGTPAATVPGPADCMSRALYDSLAAAAYCPDDKPRGHLELDTVRKVDLESPASHFSLPGEISARALSRSSDDLVFDGSPLQQFMASAFAGTATPGCSMKVINPTG
jgi:hypothetical protein